jgi:hypothetical protein
VLTVKSAGARSREDDRAARRLSDSWLSDMLAGTGSSSACGRNSFKVERKKRKRENEEQFHVENS